MWAIASRIVAALFGGYAFTWGFTAAGVATLVALGVDFHDAEMGVVIVAFILFLGLFLWALTAPKVSRVWAVLACGAAALFCTAWAIQRTLLF